MKVKKHTQIKHTHTHTHTHLKSSLKGKNKICISALDHFDLVLPNFFIFIFLI